MKRRQSTRWDLPATGRQCIALVRLGVKDENLPKTRGEARKLIYELHRRNDKGKEVTSNVIH